MGVIRPARVHKTHGDRLSILDQSEAHLLQVADDVSNVPHDVPDGGRGENGNGNVRVFESGEEARKDKCVDGVVPGGADELHEGSVESEVVSGGTEGESKDDTVDLPLVGLSVSAFDALGEGSGDGAREISTMSGAKAMGWAASTIGRRAGRRGRHAQYSQIQVLEGKQQWSCEG